MFVNRLPEMAGGWGGELMRVEVDFLVLDGLLVLLLSCHSTSHMLTLSRMVAIGSVSLTVFYPGIFFPEMLGRKTAGSETNIKLHSSPQSLA